MQEEVMYKAQKQKTVKPRAGAGVATLLVAGGGILLFATLTDIDIMEYLWPLFIIGPALLMLRPAYLSTPSQQSNWSFLAIPGSLFLTIGVLLFTMNLVDHFEAWAYSWALLPAAVMAGIMYMKRFDEDSSVHVSGRQVIRVMSLIFMGFAAFFEMLIFESLGPWWPLLFIGAGLYLYIRDR